MRALATALLLFSGCTLAPTGQLLLYVDTDATLPPPADSPPRRGDPPALFDRLRIDVYPPGATTPCRGCGREFGVDRRQFAERRASVGIALPSGVTGYRGQVRLFHTVPGQSNEPNPDVTIESVVALPPVQDEGIVEITVFLATDRLAVASGTLQAPMAATPGAPATSAVGRWPGARRVECAEPPPPGQVCVPGGAFWMGSPAVPHDAQRMRLVVLSPYHLDAHKVTVSKYRLEADPIDVLPWSGRCKREVLDYCTFPRREGDERDCDGVPRSELPLNCISWQAASSYCQSRGSDLPTESQLEYAAGGLAGWPFVWGSDPPTCRDVVFERSRWFGDVPACRSRSAYGGPLPVGTGVRDQLQLPGGTIYELTGNLHEWAADRWNRADEPCWGAGVRRDPLCDTVSDEDGEQRTIKIGSWEDHAIDILAAARGSADERVTAPSLGFRCATPAAPAP